MITYRCIIDYRRGFHTSKKQQIVQDQREKPEKSAVRKKDPKNACAKKWDPYNAPPLRRQRESLHQMVGTAEEKNPEKLGL
ncbi:hypothetical protein, partial [Trabulsiella odontotermitis]